MTSLQRGLVESFTKSGTEFALPQLTAKDLNLLVIAKPAVGENTTVTGLKVFVSNDKTDFTEIASAEDGDAGENVGIHYRNFPGRYVRITATTAGSYTIVVT